MARTRTHRQVAGIELGSSKGQATAVLFYHLARLLVWGQVHPELAAADPEFHHLMRGAADALAKVGAMGGSEPVSPGSRQAKSSPGLQGFGITAARGCQ